MLINSNSAHSFNNFTKPSFELWLEDFKDKARNEGISEKGISFLDGIEFNKRVVKTDKKHFKSKKSFHQYRGRAISHFRITEGRELYNQHKNILKQAEADYGVDAHVLVALWGIETLFGSYMGEKYIPEAIASLAYDGRRAKYFTKELVKALQIAQEGHVERDYFKGSWAGAMGQCQFMPSSFLAYAVDGDQDGKRDIWSNHADLFPSMANYLKQAKYKKKKYNIIELKPVSGAKKYKDKFKTLDQWYKLGFKQISGSALPRNNQKMKMIIPPYTKGSAHLVSANFDSIMRWNRSTFYSLSVLTLAEYIKDKENFFVPTRFRKPKKR